MSEAQADYLRDVFGVDPRDYETETTPPPTAAETTSPFGQAETNPSEPIPKLRLPGGTERTTEKDKTADDMKKVVDAVAKWQPRIDAITVTYDVFPQAQALGKAVKPFQDAANAGNFAGAVKHIDAVEKALAALEKAAKAVNLPDRQKKATAAGDKIDKMTDADIAKMKPADKAALVKEMLGAGKPSGKVRDAQIRLYNHTEIDPEFRKVDEKRQQAVADKLKDDKELGEARKNWPTLSEADLKKALTKMVKAQSEVYGIPTPEIVFFSTAADANGVVEGFFDPDDGKLHINTHADSTIKDFTATVNTAMHENAHHYQQELVKQLEANKLKKGDPLYEQALLFQANSIEPGGYIEPDEGQTNYQNQPLERVSWETGPATARKVADVVKPPAAGK